MVRKTPFEKRTDLTEPQKAAVRSYRDLNYEQKNWAVKISNRKQNDCDVINGCLRNPKLLDRLTAKDQRVYHSLVRRLTKAIENSTIKKGGYLYRGVHDFKGLSVYKRGKTITEHSFNSFSESVDTAKKYTGKNDKGEYIYFVLSVNKESNALYIDRKEKEWLFQRGLSYRVYDIEHVNNRTFGKAILYHLKLT